MARRRPPPDPEVLALARARLARLLGGEEDVPRRAVVRRAEEVDDVGAADARAALHGPGRESTPSVSLDELEPARRFTRWHLGVVAIVLLVGVVWGGWTWVRSRPQAVAAPTGVATASEPAASPSVTPPSAADPSPGGSGLVVHVLGAVRRPGLVRLPAGARVEDAITRAGGLRRDADPAELNLAQPLEDGVQVVVGTTRHPAGEVRAGGGSVSGTGTGSGSSGGGSAGSGSGGSTVVDLNRASADQLETLPGVGPVTAQKIVDWRQQHGRFSRVEELQEVDGIGPKTFARIAPHARV